MLIPALSGHIGICVHTDVPTLVDMYDELVSFDSDSVNNVFIYHGYKFLNRLLSEALGNRERRMHYRVGEVHVQPPDGLTPLQDHVALRAGCSALTLEIEVRRLETTLAFTHLVLLPLVSYLSVSTYHPFIAGDFP